jgi:hypothetical protein
MRYLLSAVGVFLFLMGCSGHMHPYADYLQQSVGREDHDAIAKKLGEPYRTVKLDQGGDLWIYEYCPSGSSQCQYLNVIFDKSGTLSEWFEN